MSRLLRLLVFTPCLFAANLNLANIKSVYLLPMTNGMDQYLANRLREGQVVAVTTDPQQADAILTDSIGPAFERKMNELFPPPAPEKAKDDEEDQKKDDIKEAGGAPQRVSSFRKGRGVVFLVDRKSRQVVWSTHTRPKNASVQELNRTAGRMSDDLKKEYSTK